MVGEVPSRKLPSKSSHPLVLKASLAILEWINFICIITFYSRLIQGIRENFTCWEEMSIGVLQMTVYVRVMSRMGVCLAKISTRADIYIRVDRNKRN